MVRWKLSIFVLVLLLSACGNSGGVKSESAQDKRNNFDSCKITFLKQISETEYKASQAIFDKQSEEACAPFLTGEESSIKDFVVPKPKPITKSNSSNVTFNSVCALVKKAAYAHREMTNYNDDADDYYDKWYGKIRAYFREAASLMRSLSGNYSGLIADAQSASTNARGVNAGSLTYAEERLYVACEISEETVTEDFMKWLDAKYPE